MDMLNGCPITAAYNNAFDKEREYSIEELSALLSMNESRATSMGVALLMPRSLVVNRVSAAIAPRKKIPLYGNSVLCDGDRTLIGTLSEHFQVSYKSMFYRLRDLNLFAPKEIDEYIDSSLSGLGGVQ